MTEIFSDLRNSADFERAAAYALELVAQDKSVSDALDHAVQKYGVDRVTLDNYLARHRTNVRNSELGTIFGSMSTPSSAIGIV
jgi:hypothetical protein